MTPFFIKLFELTSNIVTPLSAVGVALVIFAWLACKILGSKKTIGVSSNQSFKLFVRILDWAAIFVILTLLCGLLGYALKLNALSSKAETAVEKIEKYRAEVEGIRDTMVAIARDSNAARKDISEVKNLSESAIDKAQKANDIVKTAQDSIAKINNINDFQLLILEANNDDRRSWEQLAKIGYSSNSEFSEVAQQNYEGITLRYLSINGNYYMDWNEIKSSIGFTPDMATCDQLYDLVSRKNVSTAIRMAAMDYVEEASRFSKYEKIQFYINVMQNTDSVACLGRAINRLREYTKVGYNMRSPEKFLDWWRENQEKVKLETSR